MSNLIALPNGTELVGDFRIERVLGAGGFGVTYLADELALGRMVTIKEYFPSDFAARTDGIEAAPRSQDCAGDYRWGLDRFIEEAQTLAKFNHPNIVRVYRYFRANSTGYMVLHFEEGQSLKSWLKGLGRAPRQKELDQIIEPLLEALEVIHSADFLHRDIAPDNIIIRKNGQPVLIDFGSARGEIAAHSKTVSALVKPGYSPYEQYAETSRQQGAWTDIYALAATLYHAVTGKRPPDAPSRMVADEMVPAREAALSSYRQRFLKAIDQALQLNIDHRPRSVAAWRGELLAPDPVKASWLARVREVTGRPARGGSGSDMAEDASTFRHGSSVPGAPPPPDAPGPQGGMLDFVDGLKDGRKRRPLAEALAGAAAADQAVLPTAPTRADAAARKKNGAAAEAISMPPASNGKSLRLFPFGLGRRGQSEPKRIPQPDALPANLKARPAAAVAIPAEPVARAGLPVPVGPPDRRKEPRPRARPDGHSGGWRSKALTFLVVAGLAAGLIAAQNRLGGVDFARIVRPDQVPVTGDASRYGQSTRPGSDVRVQPTAPTRADTAPLNPLIREVAGHAGAITGLAYGADGRTFLTIGSDATLKVWDASSGASLRTIPMDHGAATALAVQGATVATGHADGFVALWDIATGAKLADFQRNEATIWAIVPTALPGRLAAASHDWKVTLWDQRSPGEPVHVFSGHESSVQALAVTPGATYLASGGADRTVRVWNLDTLDTVRTYGRHADFVTSLAMAPDGRQIAAGVLNGDITVWSATSRRTIRRLRGHKARINALAYAPTGSVLASSSKDGTIRLWNLRSGSTIRTFASHAGSVTGLAVSPDGERLISAGDDGKVRIWHLAAAVSRGRG
ncbi:MAG: protein kinase [Hyphomicrobiaceae bacterium]|nr:protein kinase [Hyphomicrobiaceae bacterium]